jgi:hypothetical protein
MNERFPNAGGRESAGHRRSFNELWTGADNRNDVHGN